MKFFIKKSTLMLVIFITIITLTACAKNPKADIVTTLYPQYDIAKQITKDKLTVKLMTPFGSEIHSYEPTAKDIIHVQEAKLFIFTSHTMERWVKNIIVNSTNALDLSTSYTLVPYDNKDAVTDDLHYWTDPTIILQLIDVIKERIIAIDPENKAFYEENALQYYQEIQQTHEELTIFLKYKNNPSVYFYGHNAMSSFGNRYNINIISLSTNYKPDAELSPGQLLTLKNKMIEAKAAYLFVEELIDLKAPNALINELKKDDYLVELLELHGFHNISSKQNREGVRYVDLLKQNLENLKNALD